MAEYLAPGVYVEEVDTGPRPIEGVSTSTAGMIGMTERGPVNRPILITSAGEFDRWFGGILPRDDFADPADPGRSHCYLPYAIQGFFTNGGKRVYVTRVLPDEAAPAAGELFDRGTDVGDAGSVLLGSVGEGGGLAAAPLYLLDVAGVAINDWIRIGDGSRAEYRQAAAAPNAIARHIALSRPLSQAHGTGTNAVFVGAPTLIASTSSLDAAATAGAAVVAIGSDVDLVAQARPFLVQLSAGGTTEIAAVLAQPTQISAGHYRVVLNEALSQGYPAGTTVTLADSVAGNTTLGAAAAPGDTVALADAATSFSAGQIVEFDAGAGNHEVRMQGDLTAITLAQPLPAIAPAGSVIVNVALSNSATIPAKALTGAVAAGNRVISLDNREQLEVGQVLRIGTGLDEEFAAIIAVPGGGGSAPDAGTVTLAFALGHDHPDATTVQVLDAPAFSAGNQSSYVVLDAAAGTDSLLAASGQGYAAADGVLVRRPDGSVSYHTIGSVGPVTTTGDVTLTTGVSGTHTLGEAVIERRGLIDVQALDAGAWGNRLAISVEDAAIGLLAGARTVSLNAPQQMRLTALTGIERGTVLEVTNPATGSSILLKVRSTDPTTATVTLDGNGLDATALAALGPIGGPLSVRSREFTVTVNLFRRPDPAVPSRNSQIIASETFPQLSMDHRHPRYFPAIIGDINGPLRLEDGRPEGESLLIRVSDQAATNADLERIRVGPEALIDILPSGRARAARQRLTGGDDSIATMADPIYLGADAAEPLDRTGLETLRNVPQISIVAIPGQASVAVQGGLIAHCEAMRYRFAVLDAETADASLADVQAQRLAFDSKYAALYYPWLTIPDPMPDNPAAVRDFHLPPSGHTIGIYARTDNTRGVHKAPANEVVLGITGLSKKLSKGEHDILNPMNICVNRDFRPDGRSIRVWGARVLTSDSNHKYVPVRRLLIYLEQSIEIGLQYVVFEPNAEPLWFRVRKTIENFLTDVWRDGALEGTKPAEAFFVKCDRTTMTQSDIDNGRLIVLVGVAPVKPAEFVIIRLGFLTAVGDE